MKKLSTLILLILAAPVMAGPRMTVLLPVPDAMSPQTISQSFRGSASVQAAFPDSPITDVANAVYASDVALIVLDATYGPLPANREHVLIARQARAPVTMVLITNVDALYAAVGTIDGDELLALEEQEIRTVLELYGVGGAETAVYHDSADPKRATQTMVGNLKRLVADLGSLRTTRPASESLRSVPGAEGEIYLLTHEESDGHGVTIEGARSLQLWIAGQSTTASVSVDGVAQPGDPASFRYRTDKPMPAAPATRMMLLNGGRVVGVGVVTDVTQR